MIVTCPGCPGPDCGRCEGRGVLVRTHRPLTRREAARLRAEGALAAARWKADRAAG